MGERESFLGTAATAPGPDGPWMLRRFGAIRRNPLTFLDEVWRSWGDVVQFPIPRPASYLVSGPAGVRHVLVDEARSYGKDTIQYSSLAQVTGWGLLASDTAQWRRQRPLVQPAFHPRTLDSVVDRTAEALASLIDDWDARVGMSPIVDVDDSMMRLSLEVVGHALLGDDLRDDGLLDAIPRALDVVVARARTPVPIPRWLPTSGNRRLAASRARFDGAVRRIVARRSARHDTSVAGGGPRDMLDHMLMAAGNVDDAEVRDQVVTFVVAGHETVASALTWAWALLASDAGVQERLAAESAQVLAGRLPTFADLGRLSFARAVVDEALRLYPPAWLLTRKSTAPDEIDGIEVPEGALVIVSPWIVHRHPDAWPEPEAFRPDRFLTGEVDRLAYLPFGAGPRQCIGRDFALVEATCVLATLAGRYSFDYPDGRRIPDALPRVTLRPDGGLHLALRARW